jgi:hypothetical protein
LLHRVYTGRLLLSVCGRHSSHEHPNDRKHCCSHNSLDRNQNISLSKMRDFVRLGEIALAYGKI